MSYKTFQHERKGIIHTIFRINFLGIKVQCGTITDISKSDSAKDIKKKDNFKYKIALHYQLFAKFKDIPLENFHLYFNDFTEISNIVHLNGDEFMLNIFE